MNLFGTDGIRGRYGHYPLDDLTIRKVGFAISQSFNDDRIKKIFIAHDGRESCDSIFRNLSKGILSDRTYEIILLDLFPTPALAYILSNNESSDAIGIEITASHNPYTDNGIKIFDKLGMKIDSYQENVIETIIDSQSEIINNNKLKISHGSSSRELYINNLSKLISSATKPSYKLNIAVDCANGATSEIISEINYPKNISLKIFNNSPNGKNINDKCGAVYPEYLADVVCKSNKNNKSDYIHFGVCFDGDGDRAILIDSAGRILDGDDLLYLFAYFSKENKKVVGTVMTNYGIRKNLNKIGIDFIETDVGDKNVLESMMRYGAFLGAESSGHIIHTNINRIPIGDGLITMIMFIRLLTQLNKSIEDIYPISLKIPSKLINIESPSPDLFLKENQLIFTEIKKILGNNGRILIRKSGTQSIIRILIEHESTELLNDVEEKIKVVT